MAQLAVIAQTTDNKRLISVITPHNHFVDAVKILGTKVRLVPQGENKGQLEIEYYSAEDLDRIYEVIVGRDN